MNLVKYVEEQLVVKKAMPDFKAGDTITVNYKIKEGDKERVQQYQGVVIQRRGMGASSSFTVRKVSNGVGVERVFPTYSPFIESVEVNKEGVVRRARIYYIRNAKGKKGRIEEKQRLSGDEIAAAAANKAAAAPVVEKV
ncbi:MAG TPA: 50S ribosomal protein L19 [Bacteroidia bacterium]|jgi:large subunit ribosomal protein L19|nr:50S ribosomal protein L19 [Bacteroidia bacterium]